MAWSQQGNLKGPAGTLAVGTVTTGAAGSSASVTNTGDSSSAILNFVIPKGDTGADGKGIEIAGTVATYAALPTGLTSADAGKGYFVTADGDLYVWDGSAFPANGAGIAFQGPPGTAATVAVGTVTTGAAGTSAAVSNSGSAGAAVFNFTIPRGDVGTAGAAATITLGTVTTGAAGSSASITNSGSSTAATFNFTIPRGDAGTNGTNGTKWFNGAGAPGTVAGAVAGDYYLDTTGGNVYLLS